MKTTFFKLLIALFLIFTLLTPSQTFKQAAAQSGSQPEGVTGANSWTFRGPKINTSAGNAPSVMQILYDRTNSSVVYAGTNQGVYRSSDGGETWEAHNQGLGGYGDLVISGIAQDPVDSATFIIGTWGYGVFRSTNNGDTWTRLTDPLATVTEQPANTNEPELPQVRAGGRSPLMLPDPLPVDPKKPGLESPLPSPSIVPEHPPASPDGLPNSLSWTPVRRVAINPSNRNEYFACISNGYGLYRSMDAGVTWSKVSLSAGESGSAYAYVFAPSNSSVRYAAFNNGLYRTTNGSSWTQVGSSTISATPFSVAIHPSNTNYVVVGTLGGGLYQTTTGGNSWNYVSGSLSDSSFFSVAFSPSSPNIVYAGGYTWVYMSTDTGATWGNADTGFPTFYVEGLAIHPSSPQTVLVGANRFAIGGVYKRTSSSASFVLKPTGMDDTFVLDIRQDPSNTSVLYAGTWGGGVFRSDDGGYNWSSKYGYPYIYSIEATQGPTGTILYGGTFYADVGVIKSWDRGETWHEISYGYSSDISFDLQSVNNNPNWLVAATYQGVQYTQDGGLTWSNATGLTDGVVLSLCQFSGNGPFLAATYGGGLYFSYQGFSWYDANLGMTGPNSNYTYKVACSPDKPGLAYAGSLGVYRTTDYGEHWKPMNAGLPGGYYIRDLDVVPGTGDVFAGTHQNGVYLAPNGFPVWSPINSGLFELRTRAMEVVGSSPVRAFVGTNGRGAWDYTITSRPANYTVGLPAIARTNYAFYSTSDTYEYNDYIGNAYILPGPGKYDSYIWNSNDIADWYRINVTTLGPVTINLDNIPPGNDYDVELYTGSSLLIGGSWLSNNFSEKIQFYPNQTGYYYIKISSFKGNSLQNAYRLTVAYNGSLGSGQISGTVRDNNSLATGVPLVMYYYNGYNNSNPIRLYTMTDSSGNYNFRGMPTLPVGHLYRVAYLNNEDNTNRLYRWYCNYFTGYVAGQNYSACSFNIHDVVATSPNPGATATPPVTFYWNRRTPTTDSYDLRLHDDNFSTYFESGTLGYVNNYTLYNLPGGFNYGVTYDWDVMVYDSSGYGIPYWYFNITFSSTGAQISTGASHKQVDLPNQAYLPGLPEQPELPLQAIDQPIEKR